MVSNLSPFVSLFQIIWEEIWCSIYFPFLCLYKSIWEEIEYTSPNGLNSFTVYFPISNYLGKIWVSILLSLFCASIIYVFIWEDIEYTSPDSLNSFPV